MTISEEISRSSCVKNEFFDFKNVIFIYHLIVKSSNKNSKKANIQHRMIEQGIGVQLNNCHKIMHCPVQNHRKSHHYRSDDENRQSAAISFGYLIPNQGIGSEKGNIIIK